MFVRNEDWIFVIKPVIEEMRAATMTALAKAPPVHRYFQN
jgi:hypothetical protein